MKDYANTDPRSVAAQLRGRGDGRDKVWAVFSEVASESFPQLDSVELTDLYAQLLARHGAPMAALPPGTGIHQDKLVKLIWEYQK